MTKMAKNYKIQKYRIKNMLKSRNFVKFDPKNSLSICQQRASHMTVTEQLKFILLPKCGLHI